MSFAFQRINRLWSTRRFSVIFDNCDYLFICSCLLQIIGAVTTYLVILIQFQLSFANPKQNGTVSAVLPVSTSSDLFLPTLPPQIKPCGDPSSLSLQFNTGREDKCSVSRVFYLIQSAINVSCSGFLSSAWDEKVCCALTD